MTVDGSWGDVPRWDLARLVTAAFHEAGHVVIALAFGLPIDHATIDPDECGDACDGRVQHQEGYDENISQRVFWAFPGNAEDQVRDWCIAYYRAHLLSTVGGVAASRRCWGATYPGEDQYDRAWFEDLIDLIPMAAALPPVDDAHLYPAAIAEAERLLTEHWPAVGAVALALLRHFRLTGDELVAIADGADPTLHAADRRADYQATLARAAQTYAEVAKSVEAAEAAEALPQGAHPATGGGGVVWERDVPRTEAKHRAAG